MISCPLAIPAAMYLLTIHRPRYTPNTTAVQAIDRGHGATYLCCMRVAGNKNACLTALRRFQLGVGACSHVATLTWMLISALDNYLAGIKIGHQRLFSTKYLWQVSGTYVLWRIDTKRTYGALNGQSCKSKYDIFLTGNRRKYRPCVPRTQLLTQVPTYLPRYVPTQVSQTESIFIACQNRQVGKVGQRYLLKMIGLRDVVSIGCERQGERYGPRWRVSIFHSSVLLYYLFLI